MYLLVIFNMLLKCRKAYGGRENPSVLHPFEGIKCVKGGKVVYKIIFHHEIKIENSSEYCSIYYK